MLNKPEIWGPTCGRHGRRQRKLCPPEPWKGTFVLLKAAQCVVVCKAGQVVKSTLPCPLEAEWPWQSHLLSVSHICQRSAERHRWVSPGQLLRWPCGHIAAGAFDTMSFLPVWGPSDHSGAFPCAL